MTLLPLSTAVRVWDMFLLEGTPYLLRTALAIFDLLRPALLLLRGGEREEKEKEKDACADMDAAERIQVRWTMGRGVGKTCRGAHPGALDDGDGKSK